MMDFMGPVSMMQGGAAGFAPGPSRSITSSDFGSGGNTAGYIRSGGYTATAYEASGGTLSGTLLTGFVTDAILWVSASEDLISVYIVGDAVAALDGLSAMTIGGVPCALAGPPESDGTITGITLVGSAALIASTSQTIQLI